ncbi:MAG: FHA domain-containing protein [Candidatus Riflebacteria bacterium]|nr:FHA domain-containing protein [Candidatus Riflebacteria bacterium]
MDNNDLIVINKHDLKTDYVKNRINEERESKRDLNKAERIPIQNNLLLNPVFYTAVCGLISAFVGWSLIEPLVYAGSVKHSGMLGLMVLVIVMFLCSSISSIDSLMSANFLKALKTGAIGLGVGLVWGIVGNLAAGLFMMIAQGLILTAMSGPASKMTYIIISMMTRAPAWAFLGMGAGAIPGLANYSKKIAFNGMIGGMIGGFIGGFIFDPIGHFLNSQTGAESRAIGFVALSTFIGFFVGLVENMAKDVWITMNSGPLRGKQFVIYHNPTLIGSSPKSDIYIFKDPNVMPTHAKIQRKGSKYEIIDSSKGQGVYVNSEKINGSKILEPNDTIIVGQSILEFQQKERK